LKLTTAKFYSPRSRPYSEQGVEPDVAVRVAAKPVGDGPVRPEGADDPVLEQAVRQAKTQLNAAR
jgi:C-terminal processing protease CtpA/Prc